MKLLTINEQLAFKHPERDVDFHIWQQLYTIPHSHTFYEFFIVTEGSVLHNINGKKEVLRCGTLRFIQNNDYHYQKSKNGGKTINVSFTDNFLTHYRYFNPNIVNILTSAQNEIILKLSENELTQVLQIADKILQARNSETEITMINYLILFCLQKIPDYSITKKKYPAWLSNLLNHLNYASNLSISIPACAELAGYSTSRLAVLFKQYTGQTLVHYLSKIKLTRACNMLRNTDLSVLTISVQLGYSSISHFNKIFKQRFNLTPTQYRTQYKTAELKKTN